MMFTSLESVKPALLERGFSINDPWDIVDAFEKLVAQYAGSKYAVAVDNCTDAAFLCLKYLNAGGTITVPAKTYISVPQAIIHAGCKLEFEDYDWNGIYQLKPFPVIDGATRFTKDMYVPGTYHCLSFHIKKTLAIGKGGMILTDDKDAYDWFKLARYEGRDITKPYDQDRVSFCGWNMYMPPEQAARGVELFLKLSETNPDCGGSWKYPDLRDFPLFRGTN
jgi:dTDP-4-amino-4,6-dideoxygalactose transaminase